MIDWVFCNCCEETGCNAGMTDGNTDPVGYFSWGVPEQTFDNDDEPGAVDCDPIDCVVAEFTMSFNATYTESYFLDETTGDMPWLLFLQSGDGGGTGTFERTGRTTSVEIDTEIVDFVGPTDTTRKFYVPMVVRVDSFTWNRVSSTPTYVDGISWGDFDKWELDADAPTGGTPTEGQAKCLGMTFEILPVAYVWEGAAVGITVEFDADTADSCCPELADSFCLQYVTGTATLVDQWFIGGTWTRIRDDVDCDTNDLDAAVTLNFTTGGYRYGSFGGACHLATLGITGLAGLEWDNWTWDCQASHDVKTLPAAADYDIVGPAGGADYCDMTIVSITTGDCDDGNTTGGDPDCSSVPDPGPPADCPVAHCKYRWNPDTNHYDEVYCNCIEPGMSKDDPPPDVAPGPGQPCVVYVCCIINTPTPCGDGEECVGGTCQWTWDNLPSLDWYPLIGCTIGCVCCGKPERDGLFIGETVDGVCCNATFGTGCAPG